MPISREQYEEWSRKRPYDHQVVGTSALFDRPFFMLADEMGAGKTKQAIDAACLLHRMNQIDRAVILCPASVRAVWFDQELGEVSRHGHEGMGHRVFEFHSHPRLWGMGNEAGRPTLDWFVTNYDFARDTVINSKPPRPTGNLHELSQLCGPRTLLILDESSAVKNHKSEQTKASLLLRRLSGRVVLLNGTPISNTPADLYSQSFIMHPGILGYPTFSAFKSRHARLGGFKGKEVVGWDGLDVIQARMQPHVLRRLKRDCLDLPPRLDTVTYQVPLSDKSWRAYVQMRDEMVAWLTSGQVATASQAIVKAIRLSQITSGFVGGVEKIIRDEDLEALANRPDWIGGTTADDDPGSSLDIEGSVLLGDEKIAEFLRWLGERIHEEAGFKCIVWVRFRQELDRLVAAARSKYPSAQAGRLVGGQGRAERQASLRLVHPDSAPSGPVILASTTGAGGTGHNFTAAWCNYYLSTDYSLRNFLQSRDRIDRPGQTRPVWEGRLLATGPRGQKTIDHTIAKALDAKESLASWTTSAWVKALTEAA